MKSFKDSSGAQWDIDVNLQTRSIVSARTGLDLLLIGNGDEHTLKMLLAPERSFGVICALTEKQREARKMDLDDFGAALNSVEVLDAAIDAVMEATFDFFPNRTATVLRKTMEALKEIHREDTAAGLAAAEKTVSDPNFKETLRRVLRDEPKANAGDSPASSVATPGSSPGGSST